MKIYSLLCFLFFSLNAKPDCIYTRVTVCGYKSKIIAEPLKNNSDYCVFGFRQLTDTAKKKLKEKRNGLLFESFIALCSEIPSTENFTFNRMCFDVYSKSMDKFSRDYYLDGRGVEFGSVGLNKCKGVPDYSVLVD